VADATKGTISIERQDAGTSLQERASGAYRKAVDLMDQGRVEMAYDAFYDVLRIDPKHVAARQALVALCVRRGGAAEAQGLLRDGLAVLPENTAWAMLLARLQLDGGDKTGAIATLGSTLPYAKNRPDYHAFFATVLQMQGLYKDAISHYQVAVQLSPNSGPWLTGLAISLEQDKQIPEAVDAYKRALATNALGPDLQGFVERKLAQLK
jgi:MSHA biogenesis protein MshN